MPCTISAPRPCICEGHGRMAGWPSGDNAPAPTAGLGSERWGARGSSHRARAVGRVAALAAGATVALVLAPTAEQADWPSARTAPGYRAAGLSGAALVALETHGKRTLDTRTHRGRRSIPATGGRPHTCC
eukprot:scaffold94261_cov23-Tisochrysis_lutea.AAC.2